MSLRYNLLNARTRTYLDLQGGDFRNGTPVIVYLLNQQPMGGPNQQWTFTPIPASSNLYTVQNVASGTYASMTGTACVGLEITGNASSTLWEIVAIRDPVGFFTIKAPSTNLVWTLNSLDLLSPVTLGEFNGDAAQQWSFESISLASAVLL